MYVVEVFEILPYELPCALFPTGETRIPFRDIDLPFRDIDPIMSVSKIYNGAPHNDYTSKSEDGTLTYVVDIPGVKEEDVDIEVQESIVSVRAKRTVGRSETLVKKLWLPTTHDPSSIEAHINEGVLLITAKPMPDKKPRKIQIQK